MTNSTGKAYDTTRRTLAQARRMPQWRRLIDSVHEAQKAKGYEGRQFGADEMRFFRETLIGKPIEKTDPVSAHTLTERRANFAAYWVARQVTEYADGSESVRYALKAVYGDDLANVHTIAETEWSEECIDPSPEWDATTALDFVRRAHFQGGRGA